MLLDAINNRKSKDETETTVLGPFHAPSPTVTNGENIAKSVVGDNCIVSGKIMDLDKNPIPGASIEVWQSGPDGLYDVQKDGDVVDLRATLSSLKDGSYLFRTVKPQYYPIPVDGPVGDLLNNLDRHPYRPAHIHFMVKADGYKDLVTHVFIDGDKYLESDTVFAVKKSLIRQLDEGFDEDNNQKCYNLNFDIIMEKN